MGCEPGQDSRTGSSFLGLDPHSGPLFIKGRPGCDPWVGTIPLEKGAAPHPSLLAWKILCTEKQAGYHPWGRRVGHDLHFHFL